MLMDTQLENLDSDGLVTAYMNDRKREIREERDKRLLDCDWTQGADSPLSDSDKTLWQTYRQGLRDMPTQVDSSNATQDLIIENVTWPTKPS